MSRKTACALMLLAACSGSKRPPPMAKSGSNASASASTSASSVPSSRAPHLSAKEIFVPNHDERFPDRAILAKYGTLRLDAEGITSFPPNDQGGLAMQRELTVLEKGTSLLRVSLVGQRAVRLAAYLEAADFFDVVTIGTTLLLADGTAPKRAKLEAKPGMIVTDKTVKGDRRITAFDDRYVWMDVSVPVATIGKVFTPQAAPALRHAIVAADEPLLDGPGGPKIGTVAHTDAPVEKLGEPEGAYVKIAIGGPTVRVEAWVRSAKVTPADERESVPEPQSFFISNLEKLAWLPAGTALFATAGGEQVALCESMVLAFEGYSPAKGGYVSLRVPFQGWTAAMFWIPDDVVKKAIAAREATEKRLPRIKINETVSAGLKRPHYELRSIRVAECVAQIETTSNTTISGEADVTITVSAKGKPLKVIVKPKTPFDPKLTTCLEGAFDAEIYTEDGTLAKNGTIDVALAIKPP